MQTLPAAFAALRSYHQFIIFKYAPGKASGKLEKIPVSYKTLKKHNPLDSSIWLPADEAILRVNDLGNSKSGYGVGFTLTKDDPFFLLDIDNCHDGKQWSPLASELAQAFQGAAVEVSSSNRGLHIIGTGDIPHHACRDKTGLGLELYHRDRFVALTGSGACGSVMHDCTRTLQNIVPRFFAPAILTAEHALYTGVELPDDELIARALASKTGASVFGAPETTPTFKQLWEGEADALERFFPKDGSYDKSRADASLASRLAFWTGNNAEQIERLMRKSALSREKYERHDYLPRTIKDACNKQNNFYKGGGGEKQTTESVPEVVSTQPREISLKNQHLAIITENYSTGLQSAEQQASLFSKCVYILTDNKILVSNGMLLDEKQFNVMYGGMTFVIDYENSKRVDSAYKAFTQSQIIPCRKAIRTCFKPNLPTCEIVNINGDVCANTYREPTIERKPGDPTLFLTHLKKLLPIETDREIILNYMASVVQFKGLKFQWCPIIQGTHGNGKSLLTYILSYCIGSHYTHFPKAKEIDNKFNGWLMDKLLIAIEDFYASKDKTEIMEALKPMITGTVQGIERKGVDQVSHEIVANFILNTNHKDALRLGRDDRRFAPFYTVQQSVDDLKRDGMDGDYFYELYSWLKVKDGFAICFDYLMTRPIPKEFKQSLESRAPKTSSSLESISVGLSLVEQTIQEAVEEERIGFKGNFISSHHLKLLLEESNFKYRVSKHKIFESLETLGYTRHPGLFDGRLNNPVHPDPNKSTIYVKKGSEQELLTGGAEIGKAYGLAQESC